MTQGAEQSEGSGAKAEEELRKRALAAYVAQDLGSPARDILGFLDLAVEQARELGLDDLLEYFESISQAAGMLNRLLDRVIEAGPEVVAGGAAGEVAGSDLSAKLRHDLRTPLNAIIG